MNAAGLLAVQLLDAELDQIDGRRKRLPERAALAEATAAQQQLDTERAAQQARIDAATTAIEQAEEAGAELDRKTAKLQAQLKRPSCRSQRKEWTPAWEQRWQACRILPG